eukprot:EG_transcript_9949
MPCPAPLCPSCGSARPAPVAGESLPATLWRRGGRAWALAAALSAACALLLAALNPPPSGGALQGSQTPAGQFRRGAPSLPSRDSRPVDRRIVLAAPTAAGATVAFGGLQPARAELVDLSPYLVEQRAEAFLANDKTVQEARQFLETNADVQAALQAGRRLAGEAAGHGVELGPVALALLALAGLWAARRPLLLALARLRGAGRGQQVLLGAYLVEEVPQRMDNGTAFGVFNPLWNPRKRLAVKVSRNLESWSREREVFDRLWGGGGPIVELFDAKANYDGRGGNALVQEFGDGDLKKHVAEVGPLPVREVRRLGRQALEAIARLHAAGLVWCDCKPENFVFVNGRLKAIDFETVSREGADVFGYSPETAPPEIARRKSNPALDDTFPARKSFDMWSLGMLLLHLSLGTSYWGRYGPQAIFGEMRRPDFAVDLSRVHDPLLRGLLRRLLPG